MQNSPNPSLELLFCAARQVVRGRDELALQQAIANVSDWDSFVKMAIRNAVVPMVARSLRDEKGVPLTVRKELYQHYFSGVAQNTVLTTELNEILDAFNREAIDALAYKGVALATLAYKELTLRHASSDIDLLLRKRDIARARVILEARGYRSVFSRQYDRFMLRRHYHLHLAHTDRELHVELHWALTPSCWPFLLNPEQLWGRAQCVNVAGRQVPTLNPECTLLALCAHASKEGWGRLSQILDAGLLIASHPNLNWSWTFTEARRIGRKRVLFLGLRLASELTGAPVPESVMRAVQEDPEVSPLTASIRENLVRGYSHRAAFHRIAIRIWHHRRDRVRYFFYVLHRLPEHIRLMAQPCAADGDGVSLGVRPFVLHFFLRPIRYFLKVRDPRLVLRRALRNL